MKSLDFPNRIQTSPFATAFFAMLSALPPYPLSAASPVTTTTARPPNFVFILIDDMGATDAECFGSQYYKTPHIDQLATQSIKFTQAYASCAVCSPSRAAILTGKSPARLHLTDWIPGEGTPAKSRLRLPDWQQHLALEEITLPEALKSRGYISASIGKWHLGGADSSPEQNGFDVNIAGGEPGQPGSYFWPYGDERNAHRVPGLAERGGQKGEYLTDRLTSDALKFIETNRDRPFFLYLSHYAVHSPLMAKDEITDRYRSRPGMNGQANPVYAAMLQSVDDSVGRIVRALDELHLADNTIVVFTSDNGGAVHFGNPPATSNAPLRLGKGYAYEGGLRVPLLIRLPGSQRGDTLCDAPVIGHDFFPTLLELAGMPPPASAQELDGTSLVPLLRGGSTLSRDALFWHYPHYWFRSKITPYSVARIGDWKLIRFYEDGHDELYHLPDDPSENADLAAKFPERKREIGARLDAWLKQTGAQMNPVR